MDGWAAGDSPKSHEAWLAGPLTGPGEHAVTLSPCPARDRFWQEDTVKSHWDSNQTDPGGYTYLTRM